MSPAERSALVTTGDDADTPLLTFDFKCGREVLASVDCTGPRELPGEVARLRCGVGEKVRASDTVTVRDLL